MKYKIGDKVKVKNVQTGSEINSICFVHEMEKFIGKEFTVESIDGEGYLFKEMDIEYIFVEEWLEPVIEEKVVAVGEGTSLYPCLKEIDNGEFGKAVVLFTSLNAGTVVETTDDHFVIGSYSNDFHEEDFKLFGGTITLRNEG